MKVVSLLSLLSLLFFCVSCDSGVKPSNYDKIPISNAVITDSDIVGFNKIIEKTVYVPIYSNILNYDKGDQISLQALLSLRNTDSKRELRIQKISYFDTNGNKVKEFLDKPIRIKAFGSHEVVIKSSDLEGGSGAKFLVYWEADDTLIQDPLIEVVTTGLVGSENISFSSRGVTLK